MNAFLDRELQEQLLVETDAVPPTLWQPVAPVTALESSDPFTECRVALEQRPTRIGWGWDEPFDRPADALPRNGFSRCSSSLSETPKHPQTSSMTLGVTIAAADEASSSSATTAATKRLSRRHQNMEPLQHLSHFAHPPPFEHRPGANDVYDDDDHYAAYKEARLSTHEPAGSASVREHSRGTGAGAGPLLRARKSKSARLPKERTVKVTLMPMDQLRALEKSAGADLSALIRRETAEREKRQK